MKDIKSAITEQEEFCQKKSPDGRYMLIIADQEDNYNGSRVWKLQIENRLNKDIRRIDFANIPDSRKRELYWGVCSLLFVFYTLDKPTLKEMLVVYDIGRNRYARIGTGNLFNVLTFLFPMYRKHIIKRRVKSRFGSLQWIEAE